MVSMMVSSRENANRMFQCLPVSLLQTEVRIPLICSLFNWNSRRQRRMVDSSVMQSALCSNAAWIVFASCCLWGWIKSGSSLCSLWQRSHRRRRIRTWMEAPSSRITLRSRESLLWSILSQTGQTDFSLLLTKNTCFIIERYVVLWYYNHVFGKHHDTRSIFGRWDIVRGAFSFTSIPVIHWIVYRYLVDKARGQLRLLMDNGREQLGVNNWCQ